MTTLTNQRRATVTADTSAASGMRLEARRVTQHAGETQLLRALDLAVEPGELVAVVGGSGAGKTTLLETLAGLRAASSGTVTYDGAPTDEAAPTAEAIGYVPQDNIIHGDLPLGRTLHHAARLRLGHTWSKAAIDSLVAETLVRLDLLARADVAVRDLSGGQRKRASIAVELLTRPRLLFLDEPTSGLDPATAAEVVGLLRSLSDDGTTVVLTTHSPEDVTGCDRVVILARDGYLAYDGAPNDATRYFEVERLSQIYTRLAEEGTPAWWGNRFGALRGLGGSRPAPSAVAPTADQSRRPRPSIRRVVGQWATLTQRNAELLLRNRLTLAITLGSPLLVTAMMTMLFQPGAFDGSQPIEGINLTFWLSFDAFFFGVTYGLLQVVTEFPIFRRERRSGVGIGAYVASKIAVLLPVLIAIDILVLGVLRVTDRLPAEGLDVYAPLAAVFLLDALVGLAFGLFASALVREPAQAALALPMICFPQVLFAGAVVPVNAMAAPGAYMSALISNRWAFEAMARVLDAGQGADVVGLPDYGSAISGSPVPGALVMAAMVIALIAVTVFTLNRRAQTS